jgi:hypothetical protein
MQEDIQPIECVNIQTECVSYNSTSPIFWCVTRYLPSKFTNENRRSPSPIGHLKEESREIFNQLSVSTFMSMNYTQNDRAR